MPDILVPYGFAGSTLAILRHFPIKASSTAF